MKVKKINYDSCENPPETTYLKKNSQIIIFLIIIFNKSNNNNHKEIIELFHKINNSIQMLNNFLNNQKMSK